MGITGTSWTRLSEQAAKNELIASYPLGGNQPLKRPPTGEVGEPSVGRVALSFGSVVLLMSGLASAGDSYPKGSSKSRGQMSGSANQPFADDVA